MSYGYHGDLTVNVKQVTHIVLFLLLYLTNITCSNSTMKTPEISVKLLKFTNITQKLFNEV